MQDIKSYHGFLVLPRHSKLLRYDLGYLLFGIYLELIMEAIWFRGNSKIGYVPKNQTELAGILGYNQSTVSRHLENLEKRKYIIRHTKHKLIKLSYFPLFLHDVAMKMHSNNYANMNELYADMYKINAELQDNYAKTQDERGQKNTQRVNNSFKDNSEFFAQNENLTDVLDIENND